MDLESAFLRDIQEHPCDQTLWLILADWLEDQPDPDLHARGDLLRLTYALRHDPTSPEQPRRERRLRELLAAGVRPSVPVLVNSIGLQLVLVPAGRFLMGSPDNEAHRDPDEGPVREVEISRPFYLGRCQVTQREYEAVTGENPACFSATYKGGPEHPVENVSWPDAESFCQRLSALPEEKKAGRTYRLPTEAEWEYACRAGTTTAFAFGPVLTSDQANFDGRHPYGDVPHGAYLQRTTVVGSYAPNAFGLCDMHGNVREWCADWYDENYYTRAQPTDPPGPERGETKVQRGGSWAADGMLCRSGSRVRNLPDERNSIFGFRVAVSIGP
jgi:uncharacterized protein (TIGR02996 family)